MIRIPAFGFRCAILGIQPNIVSEEGNHFDLYRLYTYIVAFMPIL
jgi:hypothetical protein